MLREPLWVPVSRALFPSPVRADSIPPQSPVVQDTGTQTPRSPTSSLPVGALVHLTFTMGSPFLKLCKAPLFPTLPQASHLNKYFLISIIQDFFFLHTDSSFTFKTLTFSCPVAGQPSEWTLHSSPSVLPPRRPRPSRVRPTASLTHLLLHSHAVPSRPHALTSDLATAPKAPSLRAPFHSDLF